MSERSEPARAAESGKAGSPLPPPVPLAVEIVGLCKRFGAKVAVDQLTLGVPTGSFYGLVGPNGAGKTTTLRMLTGLLRPDAGIVRVGGADVYPDPTSVKARLGVVPDGLSLFERLSGAEMLQYAGMLRGLGERQSTSRAAQLLEVLGLAGDAGTLIIDYSHGMKKKAALGAALIHRPEVLVLDEPFEGIDPVSAVNIRAVLDRFLGGGGTVLLSSHVMDLVERLCSHVAVIDGGRLLAAGSVAQLMGDQRLEEAFIDLVGGAGHDAELDWLDRP